MFFCRSEFVFSLWLCFFSDNLKAQDNTSTISIEPPVVIEAERVPQTVRPDRSEIQPPSGVGAKNIDAPVNSLGIEMINIDHNQDLSESWSHQPWRLSLPTSRRVWLTQSSLDLSQDQSLKVRTTGPLANSISAIEVGASEDNRPITYLENQGDPYSTEKQKIATRPNHSSRKHASLETKYKSWQAQAEYDQKAADVQTGAMSLGSKDQNQSSLGGKWQSSLLSITPFVQTRNENYLALRQPLDSNSTSSRRLGLQNEVTLSPRFSVQAIVSKEDQARKYTDLSTLSFARSHVKILGSFSDFSTSWIEFRAHAFNEVVEDQIISSKTSKLSATKQDNIWDAGIDASSSHASALGAVLQVRRYALIPTPREKFGDGILLQGSNDLPPETGLRLSIGPWWSQGEDEAHFSFFTENSENSPIMVATSPTNVRTLPLGGVWSRGVTLGSTFHWNSFAIVHTSTYQEVFNASDISWQRGQAIPGRPQWSANTDINYQWNSYQGGLMHTYRSEDALDLGGLWISPPEHQLNIYLGYAQKTWDLRLAFNHLIESNTLPQNSLFQGRANVNLLEPSFQQKEIRLLCEFIL